MAKPRSKQDTSGSANPLVTRPFAVLNADSLPSIRTGSSLAGPPVPTKKAKPGRVNVRREKAGRRGKWVTVIYDFPPAAIKELPIILKQLQAQLSTGGTVKHERIELQGDHQKAVFTQLRELGFRPVQAGA